MATDFNRMIQEIPSESLQTLLATVRSEGINPFSESVSMSSSIPPLDCLRLGDVLEIQGPPASGKTHLMYLLMIICIIPITYDGWDKVVVLIDTDASFNLSRFKHLLTSHLVKRLRDSDALRLLVKQSLQNLHLFRPSSSAQLAATLFHLPSYHRTKLPNSEIGILAVDSLSAFYWSDRFVYEQLRPTNSRAASPFYHVTAALQRIHTSHKPMIIMTNWGLNPTKTSDSRGVTLYRQHLNPPPAVFPSNEYGGYLPLTQHITLSLPEVSQYSVNVSLTDAYAQESSKSFAPHLSRGVVHSAGSSQTTQFVFSVEMDGLNITAAAL